MSAFGLPAALKKSIAFRGYVSAYIDLLGLSNRLCTLDGLHSDGITLAEQRRLCSEAIVPIEAVRANFRQFYENFGVGPSLAALPSNMRELAMKEVFVDTTIVQSFGDSILISVPIEPERLRVTWRGVYAMFAALAGSQLTLLLGGQLCRGGASIGISAEAFPGEVLGSSVAKSVALEKSVAKQPRIVIDLELVSFCREEQASPDSLVRNIAQATLQLVIEDYDGQHIIDFGGASVVREHSRAAGRKWDEFTRQMWSRIHAGQMKIEQAEKYRWLERYLASRIPKP